MVKLLPIGTRVVLLYKYKRHEMSVNVGDRGTITGYWNRGTLPFHGKYETKDSKSDGFSPYIIRWDNGVGNMTFNIDQVAPVMDIVSVFRNRFLEIE